MAQRRINRAFNLDLPQHKRAQIKAEADSNLQIIGAGLPRTGTTSLKAALEILGFEPCHHMSELLDYPKKSLLFADLMKAPSQLSPEESRSRQDRIAHHMRGYLATVDSPGCDVYQDLMTLYPNAKVVLSIRDSDEAWWKSFSDSLGAQMTTRYEWLTYPIPFLRCNEILVHAIARRWMRLAGTDHLGPEIHRAHNKEVQSNVPREKLLVYNVKMGWKPLCEFLEVPVPEQPFPNMNDAKMIARILKGAQIMGACVWVLYLGLAFLSLSVMIWPQYILNLLRDFVGFVARR